MKNKKAVSAIVSTILLILISFIAVMIVWNVMRGIAKRSQDTSTTNIATMFVGMNIEGSVYVHYSSDPATPSRLKFSVTRGFDSANIGELRITVTGLDSSNNEKTLIFNEPAPGPLGTRAYDLIIEGIESNANIVINPIETTTQKPLEKVEYEVDASDVEPLTSSVWTGFTGSTPDVGTCTESNVSKSIVCTDGIMEDTREITNSSCGKSTEVARGAYCLPEDYVSYWKFDGNANDEKGINDGILTGGASCVFEASRDYESIGTANVLSLDGVDDYVSTTKTMAEMGIDPINKDISISAWFKTSNVGIQYIINNYHWGWVLGVGYVDNANKKLCVTNYEGALGYERYCSSSFVNDGIWHHAFAIIYKDGTDPVLYLDNIPQSSDMHLDARVVRIVDTGKDIMIGRRSATADRFFNGNIDNVMIYNKALSANEVEAIYNLQKV